MSEGRGRSDTFLFIPNSALRSPVRANIVATFAGILLTQRVLTYMVIYLNPLCAPQVMRSMYVYRMPLRHNSVAQVGTARPSSRQRP